MAKWFLTDYSATVGQIVMTFSADPYELQKLDVRICVQPNYPIIILMMLNGFYKFAITMGPNTSDQIGLDRWSRGRPTGYQVLKG